MALDSELKQNLTKIANTIRVLSMEAVQKADSGHPGMPMGCAELGAYLYGHYLKYNPKDSKWINRDHFYLSAGHGSMWLYSCLHLAGYNLSMEEIKNFRQLHSQTPGHPECSHTDGVETTTGPLGQGFGNAVGVALGMKLLAARFNTDEFPIINNKVYCIAGDGCIMEGVSSEVSSLAGHLNLNNLVVIYDANNVSLDGPLKESLSENTKMRYEAYGWEVYVINGNDLDEIDTVMMKIRTRQERPVLVIAHTVIGRGAPTKAGTYKVHGAPLGEEEVKAAKEQLGWPEEPFFVPQSVRDFFKQRLSKDAAFEQRWQQLFDAWARTHPEKLREYEAMYHFTMPEDLEKRLASISITGPISGRKASQEVLNYLADHLPFLIGGSADLSSSDMTMLKKFPVITADNFKGRNIKFGVREFGMATMANGLAKTQMFLPFIGTFLTFSDYMRNAIRLCSLMGEHLVYQFTHDSIFLGEDGPTHQPVEQLASLRAMPNLHVMRPADANEVKMGWVAALRYDGPTAFALSRQNLPILAETNVPYPEGVGRGAYFLKRTSQEKVDFTLVATGSEVSLAMDVARELDKLGKAVNVISMPCWEIFDKQPIEYKQALFGPKMGRGVSIEAGCSQGWHKYIGSDGITIAIDTFGASAPMRALQTEFGFTVESILDRIL